MRKILVAGNWKLHGSNAMSDELVGAIGDRTVALDGVDVAVFPPAVYIARCKSVAANRVAVGAQDVSAHAEGAYTGELAPQMLIEAGAEMVLCGHSERRQYHGETDEMVAAKALNAIDAGLHAVVCVGESLEDREAGRTNEVVGRQLGTVLDALGTERLASLTVAYEPVWAIGTGKTASPEQAQEVHAFLRSQIAQHDATMAGRLRILYGGSVKGSNAAELFACADIDGGLIGGASLTAEAFIAICEAAQ